MKIKRTTIHCDSVTLKKLTKIADKNDRTVIGQIRHWIDREGQA